MISNKVSSVDNPFYIFNPKIYYGSFGISKSLEAPPKATLTIQYIQDRDLSSYINTYADLGRIYNIYGINFLVDSFDTENYFTEINGVYVSVYTLSVSYITEVEKKASNLVLLGYAKSISTKVPSKISIVEAINYAKLNYSGDNFTIRLPDPDEFTANLNINLLEYVLSYSKLYECYVDFNESNYIKLKKINEGSLHVFTNPTNYRINTYSTSNMCPYLLEKGYTPQLFENLELNNNSLIDELPTYVKQPLPEFTICSIESSGEVYRYNPAFRYNSITINNVGSALSGELADIQNIQTLPTFSIHCQTYVGNNLVSEYLSSYERHHIGRDYGISGIGNYVAIGVLDRYSWEPTIIKRTYFNYSNWSFSQNYQAKVKTYKNEIIDVVVKNTVDFDIKFLSSAFTYTKEYVRVQKNSISAWSDLAEISQAKMKSIIRSDAILNKISSARRIDFDSDEQYEDALLEMWLSYYEERANFDALFLTSPLVGFTKISGITTDYYLVEEYPKIEDRNNFEYVPGSILRIRPETFDPDNFSAYPVDSDGYSYIVIVDPTWKPPLYVKYESNSSSSGPVYFRNPSNVYIYFEKTRKIPYLQSKLNLLWESYRYDLNIMDVAKEYEEQSRSYISEIEAIKNKKYEDPIALGNLFRATADRTVINKEIVSIDPKTGKEKKDFLEMYKELKTEYQWKPPDITAFKKITDSTSFGRPPSPQFWDQPYIELDLSYKYPDRFIYYISTVDNYRYNYLSTVNNLSAYVVKGEQLPGFPTTSFETYIKALKTYINLQHLSNFIRISLTVFGNPSIFKNINPGDFIKINEITFNETYNINSSNLRVLSISFNLDFHGKDPEGDLMVVCKGANIDLGVYEDREIQVVDKQKIDKKYGEFKII